MLNVQPTCIMGPSILEMPVPPDDHQEQEWWIEAREKEDERSACRGKNQRSDPHALEGPKLDSRLFDIKLLTLLKFCCLFRL